MRRALAATLLSVAFPASALAQAPGNPFAPLPAQPQAPLTQTVTPTVLNTSTTSSGGGLSSGAAVAIGVGAMVVLGGISLFIWYDARRRAPLRRRAAGAQAGGRVPGSKRPPKARKLSPAERRRRKRGRAR